MPRTRQTSPPPRPTALPYPQSLPSAEPFSRSTLIPGQRSGAWTAGTEHCPLLSPPSLVRSSRPPATRPEDSSCWREVQPRSLLSPQQVQRQVSDLTMFRPADSHAARALQVVSCLRAPSQGGARGQPGLGRCPPREVISRDPGCSSLSPGL